MLATIVILLGIFLAYMFGTDGNTTAMWVVIGLAAFVVFGISLSHEDDKAYVNRMHYWAMDGKERVKAQHRWEAEARAEEERERRQRMERARVAQQHREKQQQKEQRKLAKKLGIDLEITPLPLLRDRICGKCRLKLRITNWKRFGDGTTLVDYWCPVCGRQETINIGYVPLADPQKNYEEHMAYLRQKQLEHEQQQRRYEEELRAESQKKIAAWLAQFGPVYGTFECCSCGTKVKADWKRVKTPNGSRLAFECSNCGAINVKRLVS